MVIMGVIYLIVVALTACSLGPGCGMIRGDGHTEHAKPIVVAAVTALGYHTTARGCLLWGKGSFSCSIFKSSCGPGVNGIDYH